MFSGSSLHARLSLSAAIALIGVAIAYGISSETPVGTLKGRTVAQQTGVGFSSSVGLTSVSEVDGKRLNYYTTSSRTGKFQFTRIPAGDYTLRINSRAHHLKPIKITIKEGRTHNIEAELVADAPSLEMYVHQHIFTPDENPQVTCQGFVTDADSVVFTLYKVNVDSLLQEYGGSLYRLLNRGELSTNKGLDGNPALQKASELAPRITSRDQEGIFTQRFDFPVLPPGLYITRAKAGGVTAHDWVMVTQLGLIAKTVGNDVLTYTMQLKTGAPASEVAVAVYSAGKPVGSGRTGSDGLARLSASATQDDRNRTIIARQGESIAFLTSWTDGTDSSGRVIYSYTDRPVYRPGQRVHFKGIVRDRRNDAYQVAADKPMRVEVRDSRDNLVYRGSSKTDRFGSYYGHLDLNAEAATGYYTLTSTPEGASRGEESGFRVMSYRKPEFSVKVTFPKKRYLRGEIVKAKISAQYYFGAPVENAEVDYYVSRTPYWLFEGDDDWSEGYEDYGGYGESVTEGKARTDKNGEAEIEFTANWPKPDKDDPYDMDQMFSVDAYVTDLGDQSADGAGSVVATRGEFAMDVQPDRYVVEPGGKVTADILLRYFDNKPVANKQVTVTLGREHWQHGGDVDFRVIRESKVTTDEAGRASVSFTAREGSLRINAMAKDRRGNTVATSTWVWCWGGASGDVEGARYSDLQVVLDKKTYQPGDTAKVLINTSKPGATALVTVESDRIHMSRTVALTGNSTALEIPVQSSYKPNFYVSVSFVKNKKFANQEVRAKVSLKGQDLKIRVNPDKPTYKPGEQAVYRLTATDAFGKPAVAQLSVGVVDEAIYAIARDDTTPILDYFYSSKPNSVVTSFSFPQIYLSDPDKAGSPKLRTDEKSPRVRKRFLDTAHWSPSVVTDSRGEATVRFQMPDNLTTWRATVRGITTGTSCGQTTRSVLARQDMLVRLEIPRFMIQTDKATVTAVVHNYTDWSQRVSVDLKAPGIDIDGSANRNVSVAKNGVQRVRWQIAAQKPGDFAVTVTAKGDTAGDAMQLDLPVHPHGEHRPSLKAGAVLQSRTVSEVVTVRSDAIMEASKLRIRLAPSLASSMLSSLDYLAQYPWGCTEQTTSAFLPDVVLSQSFKGMGVINADLEKQLPDMVMKGLYRLYRFQLEDGGWSWYEYGKADPWMTAYVCYGLTRAREAGFPVSPQVLERGLERLSSMAPKVTADNDSAAFVYYVLSLNGRNTSSLFEQALADGQLSTTGLAYAALSLVRTGRDDLARDAMARLFSRAKDKSGMMYWTHGSWRGDAVEATALALQAAVAVDPNDSRIPLIVRWLMLERAGNYWYSTRQTAAVLYAMADYLRHSGELAPDYEVLVKVNGASVGTFRFAGDSVFDMDKVISVPAQLIRKGRNEVELAKEGEGNLYYSLELTQYTAKKSIPAVVTDSGLSVTRTYFESNRLLRADASNQAGRKISRCNVGDVVMVRLEISALQPASYMLLEDHIPAGFEILDKGDVDYWDWNYWYVGRDIRDEKIAFFLDSVPKGRQTIRYRMRAGYPGVFHAMPAQIYAMYQPDMRAATAESEFTIR